MPEDDFDFFKQEMTGVTPISTKDKVKPVTSDAVPSDSQLARRASAEGLGIVNLNILTTDYVEPVEPHDVICFKRDGVQEGVYRKLRLGKYDIHSVLDLHRKTLKQAHQSVFEFITEGVEHGLRTVMILHGKGITSDPPAFLKSYVNKWLPQMDEVLAFHSAQKHQGGVGAVYVLLRKSEKQKLENKEKHQGRR
ncbi:hypothetical protein A9Q99_07545 [Gammaproteobacteria bacterium 45_16_T64]|nr:hypothetical protein A9Q99_07545 [Gammaproteobacteria bacterium 45_16_T64]